MVMKILIKINEIIFIMWTVFYTVVHLDVLISITSNAMGGCVCAFLGKQMTKGNGQINER